ncbi:MAG: hypothetical protein M3680_18665 [Myxococcota bacterium]|nr:hypothetical protein [Myxococcota bacterium]
MAAGDVLKLKRDVLVKALDARGELVGVTVKDAALRDRLGLRADDVITAISGRAITREHDVYDAVLGTSMLDASAVYVDLRRAGTSLLVRWQLDGELRARRDPGRARASARPGLFTSGSSPFSPSP